MPTLDLADWARRLSVCRLYTLYSLEFKRNRLSHQGGIRNLLRFFFTRYTSWSKPHPSSIKRRAGPSTFSILRSRSLFEKPNTMLPPSRSCRWRFRSTVRRRQVVYRKGVPGAYDLELRQQPRRVKNSPKRSCDDLLNGNSSLAELVPLRSVLI